MDCPHFTAPDQCGVIRQLARVDALTGLTPGACAHCSNVAEPRQTINEVTVSLACYQAKDNEPERKRIMREWGHLIRREYPSWAKQAWSVATAAADWIAAGAPGVDVGTYQARLAICDGCPQRDGHRCKVCGCYVRGKASLATEACPLGLWTRHG